MSVRTLIPQTAEYIVFQNSKHLSALSIKAWLNLSAINGYNQFTLVSSIFHIQSLDGKTGSMYNSIINYWRCLFGIGSVRGIDCIGSNKRQHDRLFVCAILFYAEL